MLNNIKFELYKGFKQFKMIIFLIVMAVAPFIGAIGSKILVKTSNIKENPDALQALSFSSNAFPLYVLNGMVDLLLPVFIVILVADTLTEEYVKGTLKLALITPSKRNKVLISKLITIIIEIVTMLVILLISSYIAGNIFFDATKLLEFGTISLGMTKGLFFTFIAYAITAFVLISFTLLIFVLAINFKSFGSVVGISISLIIITPLISLAGEKVSQFLLPAYFSYYMILFTEFEPAELIKGLSIISVYGIVAFVLSYYIFNKKDIVY